MAKKFRILYWLKEVPYVFHSVAGKILLKKKYWVDHYWSCSGIVITLHLVSIQERAKCEAELLEVKPKLSPLEQL